MKELELTKKLEALALRDQLLESRQEASLRKTEQKIAEKEQEKSIKDWVSKKELQSTIKEVTEKEIIMSGLN